MKEFWSSRIRDMVPYTPGEQPKDRTFIKLNTNENPYPPSPKVLETVRDAADAALRLYPDPEAGSLRDTLARYHGVSPEQVFVGNGSDEVLAFCFQAFFGPERPVCFPDISYSFYPVYAGLFAVPYEEIPLEEDFQIPVERFLDGNGGVILPNPNAPTGIALPLEQIRRLAEGNPDVAVIVDEAYVDFGTDSALTLLADHPNLLVVRTMSKSRSLAGMRVGYAVGSPNMIAALNCVKNSFNSYTLDRIALAAAKASVEDEAYFQETRHKIMATRERTAAALEGLGFSVCPSRANFLFVSHSSKGGKELLDGLREKGILVRWWGKPRIGDHLRITVGTDEEMDRLIEALAQLTGQA
ncbi:histidinol-phosphate transaminase [Pseudoflavonifractor sp. MSJ-37]|uniref:histidinol-phosphate transaminase n=1 Tax=Pseudoflavonifractor sp. MSJ-37 TaxID=2841531 RepID=UPI001C10DD65|nr:histidinol-phosphate transaminase [Pseudoflavonifractor sp. MSJ-37]MBU5434904.1 histidinol-phosphate transaminase [Pseudoflavonifractor sp. MSJ-37]